MVGPPPLRHCAFPALPPPLNLPLLELPEGACGYFPDRQSISRAFAVSRIPGEVYQQFLDAGFRRSGRIIYQPVCHGCRACVQIRVPVNAFSPGKSQRRTWRKNNDLIVQVGEPEPTDEKYELYCRYLEGRHRDGQMERTRDAFSEFLYESPVDTLECEYRDGSGRLLAVGICDYSSRGLSTVYFYFDPDEARRGLGTYGAMAEIDLARRLRIPYYYLGYWISGCGTMDYKAGFRPHELLGPDGIWRPAEGV